MPLADSAREERAAWLRLVLTPGVGPATARDLLAAIGLPEDILAGDRTALSRVVGRQVAGALLAGSAWREQAVERALRWAESPDNRLVSLLDPDYPRRLLQITDPPPLLFVRGAPAALNAPALAIVGSRSGSRAGLQTAEAFARALGDAGFTIVSGLALGIDSAAHRGALRSASGTVAVLGTGTDTVYPASNSALADAIVAQNGAIVSEQPPGSDVRRVNFPRRNRLIAGMSLGVLVVEAALRSGSLITARLAGEFGREVMAIPGSIHSPLSKGCHQLIKQGAKLVESAQDVLAELPGTGVLDDVLRGAASPGRTASPGGVTACGAGGAASDGDLTGAAAADSDPVLRVIGWDPVSLEGLGQSLCQADPANAPDPGALVARLLSLELAGHVERLTDGRYQRRAALA